MNTLKFINKKTVLFFARSLLLILAADFLFGIVGYFLFGLYYTECREDISHLRDGLAEAYININADPNFVNTATDDQPMVIPEKYYSGRDSFHGDGPMCAVVFANGSVETYYGSPEKNLDHYRYHCGCPKDYGLSFPFILSALLHLASYPYLVPLLWFYAIVTIAIIVCRYIRRRKKKAFDATIAAIQSASNSGESI